MKFCEVCDNMLYMEVTKERDLKFYCKNCNFSGIQTAVDLSSVCVSTKSYANDANSFKNYMTPFIKYDRSLPRVNNIKCQNCDPAENEVIYVKYDHDNMKYLYFCCKCEHFWKN